MVLLPVVERELRVAARGRATYRVRFWAVLVMLGIFIWCLKTSGLDQNSRRFAEDVTGFLMLPAFVFSLFIGVLATADCVSSEKREGTLGLLFLTDLKGYDVICGKLAANSINAIYGLVAILPVLALPVMLGGVTFMQFVKLGIVLFTTMVLSLSVGIFVSTHSRNERKAMFFTVIILLAAAALPFLLAMWADPDGPSNIQKDWMLLFSPGYGIFQTMESTAFPDYTFWVCLLWQWLLAAELIARASAHIVHSWEESGPKKKPPALRPRTSARVKSRVPRGRAWLERNPFLWLALQGDEAGPRRVWLYVLAILTMWVVALMKFGNLVADEGMAVITIFVLHVPLKIWIAAEASRRFSEDRTNHTFESLLSTPLNARQIIQGQLQALLKQFAGPVGLVLAWEFFLMLYSSKKHFADAAEPMFFWTKMALLVADAAALAWAGMWLGLKCKGRIRAILAGLILVLLVPWVVTQMATTVAGALMGMSNSVILMGNSFNWNQAEWKRWQLLAALVPSLAMDLLVVVWASSRLPQKFRQLAVRR